MKKPDWTRLELDAGVLREPVQDASQFIVWLPGDLVHGYRHWDRVASVPGADVIQEDGLCRTPATIIQARQKTVGVLGKVLGLFRKSTADRDWLLPTGDVAEQLGERIKNRTLIWVEPETASLDESVIQERFGHAGPVRRIGRNVFVAVSPQPEAAPAAPAAPTAEQDGIPLFEQAKRLLDAGRAEGDWRKQALALIDLGVIFLKNGNVAKSLELLQRGLMLARANKDRSLESDAQTNIAAALSAARKHDQARAILDAELAYARQTGDRFVEKLNLDHLGVVYARALHHGQAIQVFEQALALARDLGDQRHQAELLWSLAIEHAELQQRGQAIASAQAGIDLMARTGNPKVKAHAEYLEKYRSENSSILERAPDSAISGGATDGQSSSVISTNTSPASAEMAASRSSGPGFLRMALSAATAMVKFAGSGMKTVSNNRYQKRLEICGACPHHTGVRCKLCGCFTKLKARLPHETCPLAKWPDSE